MVYVVMGVCGSGKTTVGTQLAHLLHIPFFDGDDFHPEKNKLLMQAGTPLSDEDRMPWLNALHDAILEWNKSGGAVLACSALKQSYRDILSKKSDVTFVYLEGTAQLLLQRLNSRRGHFCPPSILESQLAILEEPKNALRVSIDNNPDTIARSIIEQIENKAKNMHKKEVVKELSVSVGSVSTSLSSDEMRQLVFKTLSQLGPKKKVLIIPPDITRSASRAGEITRYAFEFFGNAVHAILPALGTHKPMSEKEITAMFGDIPQSLFVNHSFRTDLVLLGEVPGSFVADISLGMVTSAWPVEVNKHIVDPEYDCILSIGQVVPHEVAGMANHAKNILVGLGGKKSIDATHFLGAVYGMERIMGKAQNPVRTLFREGADRFLKDIPLVYILTVVDGTGEHVRGFYSGSDNTCFEEAAQLSSLVNCHWLSEPIKKCVVSLPCGEYKSTWLGNKAIYRTRMAMADGGELIILAPDIQRFGEDEKADELIRKFGYHGTNTILKSVHDGSELSMFLSVAAHCIHGSSEGRFKITYATSKLSKKEVESVGYAWADLSEMETLYGHAQKMGYHTTSHGEKFYYIANPGLGLWRIKE